MGVLFSFSYIIYHECNSLGTQVHQNVNNDHPLCYMDIGAYEGW